MASSARSAFNGALMAMPIICINLGGEMVYVLEQRLKAQKVEAEKASRVLQDVIRTMFAPHFMSELFRKQATYTPVAVRQIFEKLAHSSIMRLNSSSMDKLYELMVMGVKMQVLSCSAPDQLLTVTLRHLNSLAQIVPNTPACERVITCRDTVNQFYGELGMGEWYLVRSQIANFFASKKVKISLFLQAHLQSTDGTLMLRFTGEMPCGVRRPGCVRYYDPDGRQGDQASIPALQKTWNLHVPYRSYEDDSPAALGANLYKEGMLSHLQALAQPKPDGNSAVFHSMEDAMNDDDEAKLAQEKAQPKYSEEELKTNAVAEISVLADLLGGSKSTHQEQKSFQFNLFDGADSEKYDVTGSEVRSVTLDAKADHKGAAGLMERLDLKDTDFDAKAVSDDEEDDLLALMDSASRK